MVTITKFCVFVSVSILFYSTTETFGFMKNLSNPHDFCATGELVGNEENFWPEPDNMIVYDNLAGELLFVMQSMMYNLLRNSTSKFPNVLVCEGYKPIFTEILYRMNVE